MAIYLSKCGLGREWPASSFDTLSVRNFFVVQQPSGFDVSPFNRCDFARASKHSSGSDIDPLNAGKLRPFISFVAATSASPPAAARVRHSPCDADRVRTLAARLRHPLESSSSRPGRTSPVRRRQDSHHSRPSAAPTRAVQRSSRSVWPARRREALRLNRLTAAVSDSRPAIVRVRPWPALPLSLETLWRSLRYGAMVLHEA